MTEKPEPPSDMWEQLDAALKELRESRTVRPPDAFTTQEFCERQNIQPSWGGKLIAALLKAGKVEKIKVGKLAYFRMVK